MTVVLYSTESCPQCNNAKVFLSSKGYEFSEKKVGKDLTREEFFEKFPGVRTVPQIVVNNQHIGGFDSLIKYFR